MSPHTASTNEALTPIAADQRVFRWHDHASLWFSLGVGLLVMQVGAYLMPALGTKEALLAIVGGSLIGAGMLPFVQDNRIHVVPPCVITDDEARAGLAIYREVLAANA